MGRTVLQWKAGDTTSVVDFDAVETESPGHEVAITDYPIELGSNLTDHVRPKPVTLRITGVVTNSPSREGLSHMEEFTAVTQYRMRVRQPLFDVSPAFGAPTSLAGVPLVRETEVTAKVRIWQPDTQKIQRVEAIWNELKRAMNEARQFTVTNDVLGDFDRMLIRSLSTERSSRSGNSLRLQIDMVQVSFADLMRRNVSHLLPKPAQPRSEPKKDEGKKEPEKADAATEEAGETFLNWVTGGF